MKNKITNTFLFLFSVSAFSQGQTTNTGTLYVSPSTLMTIVSDFNNTASGEYKNDGEVLLRANFNNDGITTFNPLNSGYTRFEGFLNQKITGNTPSEFKNVLFNNANPQPAFQLYGEIRVTGNSDFFKGIVKDDDFGGLMVFENNATHTNTDNESHVDGKVKKNGTTAFQYPIGDKELYRFARISAPGENLSSFTAKYFFENSNLLYPHTNKTVEIDLIDNQEYWTVEKTGGSSDVMLTLSWDENTTTPTPIVATPESEIHIVRWDTAQNLWIDQGEVAVDVANKTATTVLNVDGYGVFTLARVNTNLSPEDIVIHNAITPNEDGKNDHFVIEGITNFPNNTVEIYNRWGVKVFETKQYDSSGNVFKGYSDGRTTVTRNEKLPEGTYFYVLKYKDNDSKNHQKAGYLYLNK